MVGNENSIEVNTKKQWGISSFTLHIIAMALMLCDHMWATVVPANQWMTNVGRLAFPIFAFMIAEGFAHTSSVKKYIIRMLVWALISEVPFNLMYEGDVFYPFHQNVMWTFLFAILGLCIIDMASKKNKWWLTGLTILGVCILAEVIGLLTQVDYNGNGIMTVFLFYFFRRRRPLDMIAQLIGLYLLNVVMFRGMMIDINLFGHVYEITQQGFAVLGIIPVWLYSGKQGPHNKYIQTFFYAFYPVHMLLLALIALYIL